MDEYEIHSQKSREGLFNLPKPHFEASFRPSIVNLVNSPSSGYSLEQEVSERLEEARAFMRSSQEESPRFSERSRSVSRSYSGKLAQLEDERNELASNRNELKTSLEKVHSQCQYMETQIRSLERDLECAICQRDSYKESLIRAESQLKEAELNNRELKKQMYKCSSVRRASSHELSMKKIIEANKHLELQIENLSLELKSRPTHKQYKEALHMLDEKKRPVSKSTNEARFRPTTDKSFTLNCILNDLMKILKVENEYEILVETKKLCNYSRLVGKISGLIKECSPKGAFDGKPKFIWKWLRNLMQNYIRIKKKAETQKGLLMKIEDLFESDPVIYEKGIRLLNSSSY